MQKLFNKVLVPVNLSGEYDKIAGVAVDMCLQYKCSLCFLHVEPLLSFGSIAIVDSPGLITVAPLQDVTAWEVKMLALRKYIFSLAGTSVKTEGLVKTGSWDETIIELVNEMKFDLVLIGQKGKGIKKRKMEINPDKIAANTNIAVITIPENTNMNGLRSIVIPVTDFLPVRKLMYGVYLASGYNAGLKLLGIINNGTREHIKYYLERAYQLIRDNCTVKVEIETAQGENIAEVLNHFTILYPTGLVIVNPGKQTKMPGLFSAFFGNVLQKYSKPPVMTVNAV